jgi:non-ribosomal peptide synthetase component E (peptide arylation enzyme)
MCQKAHMITTHAIYELFEPLLRGIPVCIISDQEAKTLEAFWDTIKRRAISRLLIVPSVLQASLDMPEFSAPDLKVLILMGEYVHPVLARRTIAAFAQTTRIYSIYGSTEASSTLLCNVREWRDQGDELPLGEPISPDVRAYVLDDRLEPVDAGSKGMLYIAGTALFTEYFRDPALTEAAFVTLGSGERLYRTNDQVRRTSDGALQYLGRTDHVVKVRGFRVDLQEVEKVMARHPNVSHCAVIATDDRDGDAMLVAFVSPAAVPAAEVYRVLREQLPDYMVPSRVIGMDALPLTSSGKIDRRKLAESSKTSIAPAPSLSARPRSPTERTLADVWKEVLGHDAFDVDSNFFEVGGSSLKTFAVMSRVARALGLEGQRLPGNAIYQLPTIEGLASYIDSVREGRAQPMATDDSVLVTLKSGRDAGAAPLFVISSAGGTLGAYEKLIRALMTTREVIGVRDPFLWGKRDPTLGFQSWASLYVGAIRERQPKGPYYVVAYSSAGAFGYEIARRLRRTGEDVALLALIDPLAIDSSDKRRFGHWAFNARFMRPQLAPVARLGAWLNQILKRRKNDEATFANDFAFTREQFLELEAHLRADQKHILQLSALLELNTGLPIALTPTELAKLEPSRYFDALLVKMDALAPDVDKEMLGRLVVQYQLQVRSQHQYRLQWFDGTLVLFDPAGPYHGLLASLFRPYANRLVVHRPALGPPTDRVRELGNRFSNSVRSHFLSMRDDAYVQTVARELEKLL